MRKVNYKKCFITRVIAILAVFSIFFGGLKTSIINMSAAPSTSFNVSPDAATTIVNNTLVSLNGSLTINEGDLTNYGDFIFEVDPIAVGNQTATMLKDNIIANSNIPLPFSLHDVVLDGGVFKITLNFDYASIAGEPFNGSFSVNYSAKYSTTQSYTGLANFKMIFNGAEFTEQRNSNIVAPVGSYVLFAKWPSLVKDNTDNYYLLKEDATKNIFYLPINYTEVDLDYIHVTDTKPVDTAYSETVPYPGDPLQDTYNYRGIRIYKILQWTTTGHNPAKVENATREYEQYITFDENGNMKFDLPAGLKSTESLIIQYGLAVTSDPEIHWTGANVAQMDYKRASNPVGGTMSFTVPLKPYFAFNDSYSFYKNVNKSVLFVDKNGQFIDGQTLEYTLRIRTYAGGIIPANQQFKDILDDNVEFISSDIDSNNWNYSISGNTFSFSNKHVINENTVYSFKIRVKVLSAVENYEIKNTFLSTTLSVSSNRVTTLLAKGSSVKVEYVDLDGNQLLSDTIVAGYVGDPFNVEAAIIDSWTLVNVIGKTEGLFTEEQQVVRFVYKQTEYTLNFDLNGGKGLVPSEQTLKVGDFATAPPNPIRDGYHFVGWNTGADGSGIDWDFSSTTMPATNVTLYAQWSIDPITTYTLSFDLNGGNGLVPSEQTLAVGDFATAPTNPIRDGYHFVGWNTEVDGSGINWDFSSTTMPATNVTLYAQWAKDKLPETGFDSYLTQFSAMLILIGTIALIANKKRIVCNSYKRVD